MTRVLGLACCLALVLAACGGDDGAEPTATMAPSVTSEQSPTAAAGKVSAIKAAPCSLITAAEVEAATGFKVLESKNDPPISCLFDLGKDSGIAIFISIEDGQGRLMGPAAVFAAYDAAVASGQAQAVSGLGTDARYSPGFRALVVDAGEGRFFSLGVNGGTQSLKDPKDALVALARAVLKRL